MTFTKAAMSATATAALTFGGTYAAATAPDVPPAATANTEAAPQPWAVIQTLRAELYATRQERTRLRVDRNRTAIALAETEATRAELEERLADLVAAGPTLAELDELWFAGYTAGGGQNREVFRTVILPGESGGERFPHDAVGPTDDWGRAQINRPVWAEKFTEITGVRFEVGVLDPTLNGFMAAYIEQAQGLTAWVTYNNHRGFA